MNISFYYRTQEDYLRVGTWIKETNVFLSSKRRWSSNTSVIQLSSRHVNKLGAEWLTNIPKSKPTDKKYLGVIHANKHLMDQNKIEIHEALEKMKIELAPILPKPQKYTGEQTRKRFKLTGLTQFKVLTSIFNKRYGHGNWNIRGPKHLQKILKNYEETFERKSNPNILTFTDDYYSNKYPDGIPVTLVVNEPGANIEKQLFKMKLKV